MKNDITEKIHDPLKTLMLEHLGEREYICESDMLPERFFEVSINTQSRIEISVQNEDFIILMKALAQAGASLIKSYEETHDVWEPVLGIQSPDKYFIKIAVKPKPKEEDAV